jgi:hypothetical protein
MALDLLDDVLRLDLALETPESVFQRLPFLNYDFRHAYSPPVLQLNFTRINRLVSVRMLDTTDQLLLVSSIGALTRSQGIICVGGCKGFVS